MIVDGKYNAVGAGVALDDLELDGAHGGADEEEVALAEGAVRLEEVGLEEGLKEVAGDALDRVVDGEDVDAGAVLDVGAGVDRDNVAQADAEVASDDWINFPKSSWFNMQPP